MTTCRTSTPTSTSPTTSCRRSTHDQEVVMDLDEARSFIREHHGAVMATRRRDGSPQMSVLVCNVDDEGRVVVSTRETAVKAKNVRRDPRVSLCILPEG